MSPLLQAEVRLPMRMNTNYRGWMSAILPLILMCVAAPSFAIPPLLQIDLNGPASGTDVTVTFTEDAGEALLCPAAVIADASTTMTELLLTMTPHPENLAEALHAVPRDGLAVTYNSGNGEMLINGTASASNYQEVLRSLTYGNASNTPTVTTRVVTAVAKTGTYQSNQCTIQINIVPTNDPPVIDLNGTSSGVNRAFAFDEGAGALPIAPAGTVTDPDSGQLTSMTLALSSHPDGGAETIAATGGGGVTAAYDPSTGVMRLSGTAQISAYQAVLQTATYNNTATPPDPTTRTLTVTGWDTGGRGGSAFARISIHPRNYAPTAIAPTGLTLAEGTAIGTTVASLQASDPNVGDTHTYAFVAPFGNGAGRFSLSGNQLRVAKALDYETSSSAMLSIKSTDKGGLSCAQNIAVAILNVNETPTNINLAPVSLYKDAVATETIVGTLTASDPDANQKFTYTFCSPYSDNGGRFKMYSNQVRVAKATLLRSESQSSYPISVRVTDQGGLNFSKNFTIELPPNPNAPVIDLNGTDAGLDRSVTFTEGGSAVKIAPAAAITDMNGTQLTSMTLALSTHPGGTSETLTATASGGVTASYNTSTGVMKLSGKASLSSYQTVLRTVAYNNTTALPDPTTRTLTVTGWDTEGLGGVAAARIAIVQINRKPTRVTPDKMTVAENSPVGTVVGTFSTVDPNRLDTHTYSFASPNYNAAGKFSLSGNTLKVAGALNHEALTTATLSIKSTDNRGLSCTTTVRVGLLDVNEPPANIDLEMVAINKSMIAADTLVGTLIGTDPDAGDTLSYTLTSDDGGRFKLAGNTLRIADATLIKADSRTSYTITARVADGSGLSITRDFTFTIPRTTAARGWTLLR
ncbi:MAG: cadherin domain-containing protein [Candidatus Sumerlaeia bacterium]